VVAERCDVAKKKDKGINPDLEAAISSLLSQVMNDEKSSITDKTKVIDRGLALEKIKQKMADDDWGAGFTLDDDEDSD
jgi:hypothetical protein